MFDFKQMAQKYNVVVRGLIQVGAHDGGELKQYQGMNIPKVLLVEANPAVYQRLVANIAGVPNVMAVNCAVSDIDGNVVLHVTSMDQSSSLLKLKHHSRIYPSVIETHQVTVPGRKLDTLLRELKLTPADFNMMNLDIQGAELMAFKGASDLLQYVELINTEVNFEELYEGCALIGQLDEFLATHHFVRVELETPWHPTWGDAIYVKKKPSTGL
jgi:FkbM family methyltransferase